MIGRFQRANQTTWTRPAIRPPVSSICHNRLEVISTRVPRWKCPSSVQFPVQPSGQDMRSLNEFEFQATYSWSPWRATREALLVLLVSWMQQDSTLGRPAGCSISAVFRLVYLGNCPAHAPWSLLFIRTASCQYTVHFCRSRVLRPNSRFFPVTLPTDAGNMSK